MSKQRMTTMLALLTLSVVTLLTRAAHAEDAAKPESDPARAMLAKEISDVMFDGVPLIDTIGFLQDASGATIWLDRAALAAVNIDSTKLGITLGVKGPAKLGDVLADVAKQMVGGKEEKCAVEVCGNVIAISTEPGAKAFVERHRDALARGGKTGLKTLDRKLPEVTFTGVGLADVIDFLRDVTGAAIDVRWDQLKAAGVDRNVPVMVRAKDVTFAQALRLILDDAHGAAAADKRLDFTVEKATLVIAPASTPKKEEPK